MKTLSVTEVAGVDQPADGFLNSETRPRRVFRPAETTRASSLWTAVERGKLGGADIAAITRQEPVYLSPVNIAEIRFGLELLPAGAKKQRAAAALRRLRRDVREVPRQTQMIARLGR